MKQKSLRKSTPEDHDDPADILTDIEVTYFGPYETFTREACIQEAEHKELFPRKGEKDVKNDFYIFAILNKEFG